MEIVRARTVDASTLTRIALAAKRHWGYPDRWIEAWRSELTLTAAYVASHPTYAALEEGTPVGFYALGGQAADARRQLDHLWLEPAWIGRGLGRRLLVHALATAAAGGADAVWLEAEPHAEAFYLHMGARRIGERVSELEGLPRVLPILELNVTGTRRLPMQPVPP